MTEPLEGKFTINWKLLVDESDELVIELLQKYGYSRKNCSEFMRLDLNDQRDIIIGFIIKELRKK